MATILTPDGPAPIEPWHAAALERLGLIVPLEPEAWRIADGSSLAEVEAALAAVIIDAHLNARGLTGR